MSLYLLQDLEKDYNPKDLAKFLLGQNPELLQQNINIQPAINRWAFFLFILIPIIISKSTHTVHLNILNIRLMSVSVLVGLLSAEYDAEESPVTDEEERPLSQEELRKRIIKGVSTIVLRLSDCLWLTS